MDKRGLRDAFGVLVPQHLLFVVYYHAQGGNNQVG